jgi:hypothetical protein
MQTPHASPFKGRPRTRVSKDRNGKPAFRLTPRVLTPARKKVADKVHWLLSAMWLLRCIFAVFNAPTITLPGIIEAGALFLVGHLVLQAIIDWALRSKTEIVMTAGTLRVRRWFFWRTFDRMLAEEFGLLHHDNSEAERFTQEFQKAQASARGNVIQPTPYYMRSFHVVMSYAGQRIDLLSVFGQKEAAAIVARLQLCNRLLDEAVGIRSARGTGARPGEEWRNAPGGV